MVDPTDIAEAIEDVKDQRTFIQRLLVDALGWPVDEHAEVIDDIAYEWTEAELRAKGLNAKIVGGKAYQIVLPGNPWGIFILEFVNPDVFTTGRGMTGVLRGVLEGLREKKRGSRDPRLAGFQNNNLLFICNYNYERYRFAHFKRPPEGATTAPMASFGWGPDDLEAVRTICEFNLRALEWPDERPTTDDDWLKAWSPAFDVEKVTTQFYRDYAAVFKRAEDLIASEKTLKGDDLRLFTQSLFNRLMFLRFIERKGWLSFPGQQGTRYLAALADAGGVAGKSLYASRVRHLFFHGLAEEGRQTAREYGSVPHLNGGLFEESPLDKKVPHIPDEVFASVIGSGGLFYKYNFTVEESTPLDIEVAVDPEMLGKVFEELVTGRHESGSYYTPRPVVSFMCREALKGYLTGKTQASESAITTLVDKHEVQGLTDAHARQIIDALDDLKAVDPACGSGAYLLGLLQELIAIRRALQSEKLIADPQFLYNLKLHTISHSLYGVDIDPFATNIAMLRLWLSLAVEMDHPLPLPNLDFKIEVGDSLAGPCALKSYQLNSLGLQKRAELLATLKNRYMNDHSLQKQKLREAIRKEEGAIAFDIVALRGKGVIDWRIHFVEAFARDVRSDDGNGFDIVLANPPYVRKEEIPAALKPMLKVNFGDAVSGRSDLYCSFYARGVELLRQGGMHVFVCSNSWLDAGYGGILQGYLLRNCHVQGIIDSAVEKQFSTANVNTIISILRKDRHGQNKESRFTLLKAPFTTTLADVINRVEVVVSQGDLVKRGSRGREYVGDKWGGKYLHAPQSYKTIFTERAERFISLDRVADVAGYIHDNNTGGNFPKKQVLWSLRDARTIGIQKKSEGIESIGVNPSGNSTDWAPILFARTMGTRHLVCWCDPGVYGKEFYKITPMPHMSGLVIAAQLNSTLGILQREVLGIKGLGGGAIKFAAADVAQFQILPDMPEEAIRSIFLRMSARTILDIEGELEQKDRRELDAVIFDQLDLPPQDREKIYSDTLAMVLGRRDKARNK